MEGIRFTQAAMYHLAAINNHLRRTVGTTYKLSKTTDLELLLKEAYVSDDPELIKRCARLLDCLWHDERKKLWNLLQDKVS